MKISCQQKIKYETVIFDLDGVVIDSSQDIADTINYILKIYNCRTKEYNYIKSCIGGGAKNILLRCLNNDKKDLIDEILGKYVKYYFDNCTKKTTLYPGIKEILEFLAGRSNVALATFKVRSATNRILEQLHVRDYFDYIVTSDDVINPKPHPECIEKILEGLQSKKEGAILIGDTPRDILTGKNAGIKTCGVLYGFGNAKDIKKAEPDHIIQDIRELLDIIA